MKKIRIFLLFALATQALAPADAQVPRRPILSAALQLKLAEHARDACAAAGFDVAIAIADGGGLVRTQLSGDTAGSLAIETARRKATSAVLVGFPTAKLGDAVKEAPAYADMLRSLHPDIIFIGGGLPIRIDGQVVGGIGVGGASGGAADETCAAKALVGLADKLR